jgi:hypothetical protein
VAERLLAGKDQNTVASTVQPLQAANVLVGGLVELVASHDEYRNAQAQQDE